MINIIKEIDIYKLDILNGKTIKSARFEGRCTNIKVKDKYKTKLKYSNLLMFVMTDGTKYYIMTDNNYITQEDV